MVAKTVDIDGPDLFDKDSRELAFYHHLGSEAGGSSAAGRGGDEDSRARQEGISLHYDSETPSLLLVALSPGWTQFVKITPLHADSP